MDTNDLLPHIGEVLNQQRCALSLTLQQVAKTARISASHLGRIERGERYPSGTMLSKLAKPFRFTDEELMHLAGYLTVTHKEDDQGRVQGRLDPVVARMLGAEPVETQRQVVAIVYMMKSLAKDITNNSANSKGGGAEWTPS